MAWVAARGVILCFGVSDIAALGLFDLAFHYVERVVYRLLECACLLLYAQVAAGYV